MKLSAVLLIENESVVNKYNFDSYRPIGKIAQTIKRLEDFQIDEIILLNRGHTQNPNQDFTSLFDSNSKKITMSTPLAYGGGISTLQHVEKLIDAGVERVVLSARHISARLTSEIAKKFGEQSIVFHLPFEIQKSSLVFKCADAIHGRDSIVEALENNLGSEVILTSIAAEGSGEFSIEDVTRVVDIIPKKFNIIYNGGVSSIIQIGDLLNLGLNGIGLGNVLNSKELFVPLLKRSYNEISRNFDMGLLKDD